MQDERRRAERRQADIWVNKFIDGLPHTARLVEVSALGCVLERIHEPEVRRELYPIEMALPVALGSTRLWLWARPVWSRGGRTGMRFVGLDPLDRATLTQLASSLA
jgi:hypothetical protein